MSILTNMNNVSERGYLKEEHHIFRKSVRKFLEKEALPFFEQWEEEKLVPHSFWRKMGEQGFLCPWIDQKYGGFNADYGYSIVLQEEVTKIGTGLNGTTVHSDVIVPYIEKYGNEEQKKRWLPGAVSGNFISAIAMTEPGNGSDLASVKTTAINKGDHYIINGAKTFITNGINGNLFIVVCKTDLDTIHTHKSISLIVVEDGTPGFSKGKQLKKLGLYSSDTAELIFEDVVVPVGNLLGEENKGFYHLMENLQQERLVMTTGAITSVERMFEITMNYVKERKVFGQSLSKFQNTQFKLAELATAIQIGRTFVDDLIQKHIEGVDITTEISMAKWWLTDFEKIMATECLQLHGGYGYIEEYEIARRYRDAAVGSIYGGSNEIMKVIIAKNLGL